MHTTMPDDSARLDTRTERFDHPAVRVMTRELTHLARDLAHGTSAWPPLPAAHSGAALPGLESIEAALYHDGAGAVAQSDWAAFTRAVLGTVGIATADSQPGEPHPAALIALRLIWGAERFSELPTVMLRPPPAAFLDHLARLLAPASQTPPAQLDQTVSSWLQENQALADQASLLLPIADVRGFVRVVAACRVVGQMRQAIALEDVAAGYLAWTRLLRANPQQLSDISSGWWSER